MKIDRENLLRTIQALRVADLELLRALCVRGPLEGRGYGFGVHGVRYAADDLLRNAYLHRLWKHRDPTFKMDRGSARQVFLISERGAQSIGLREGQWKAAEKRFQYLKDPRKSYVLEHELMIARFHGALMAGHHLQDWVQGLDTQIHQRGFKLTPDAFFQVDGRYYFLEADTGTERIGSADDKRRTITKKIRRYGYADRKELPQEQFNIPGFSVIFLTPRRSDPRIRSGREESIWKALRSDGRRDEHSRWFYRVVSETTVLECLLSKGPLPVLTNPASLEEPAVGSSPLSLIGMPPTHEAT